MLNKALLQELKAALEKEHDRLVGELKPIARPDPQLKGNWDAQFPQFEPEESGSHISREQEEDEVEEYEANLEAEHSLESRLLSVTRALERMEKGTYGACASCGGEIEHERLAANPAAEFHIKCDPGNGSETTY